jgi:cation:H+ antiporter
MSATVALEIAGGFVLLFFGAEFLVRGSSTLAARLGIPPVVIGLTVVAFGTSAPELAVSLLSASRGESGIAVGNVLGSNVFNILVILGLASLVHPLIIHTRVVWRDVPVMLGISLLTWLFASDGIVSRFDGAVMVIGLAAFLWSMRSGAEEEAEETARPTGGGWGPIATNVGTVLTGLVLLVLGSHWLVDGATTLARWMGVSELVIGLTLVATGTSLPELATSIVAALRDERDIAVGNVVGSNVFNLLGVLGIAALVSGTPVAVTRPSLVVDFPVAIGAALLCLIFFYPRHRLSRVQGGVMLACYVAYVSYLFMSALKIGIT